LLRALMRTIPNGQERTMTPESQAADDPGAQHDVDISNADALTRWAKALGLTTEALESAVHAVGPRVDRIKDYLAGGMAGHQEDA
jgi:hypothetical protein